APTSRSSNPSPFTSPTLATDVPKAAPACVAAAIVQAFGSARPLSITPSQSLSMPSQTSGDGVPGGGALQHALPSGAQAVVPDTVQAPRPTVHVLPTPNPSSMLPLQLSSMPLHSSGALGCMDGLVSSQSAPGPVAQYPS